MGRRSLRPRGRVTLLVVTSYESEGELRSPAIGPGRAKEVLDEAIALCGAAGVESSVEVDPAGPPAQVVLDWAEGHGLLALGAPATSWFGSMFVGGVGVTAEGFFDKPMLLARSTPSGGRFASPVAVASDGAEASDELVRLAARVARSQGASLVLVHARSRSSAKSRRIEEQSQELERAMDGAFELRLVARQPALGDRRGDRRRGGLARRARQPPPARHAHGREREPPGGASGRLLGPDRAAREPARDFVVVAAASP